ncbi:MAG: arylsulfotransferase family protein, partial [Chloroflexota bacterium]
MLKSTENGIDTAGIAYASQPASGAGSNLLSQPSSVDRYVTLPDDYPIIEVITNTNQTADGYLFLSVFTIDWSNRTFQLTQPYLLILDKNGEPVFHRPIGRATGDFKPLPDGTLSYFEFGSNRFTILDDSYSEIRSWEAIGYPTDNHDLQILPNGNAVLMVYDTRPVDMSRLVPGGRPDALVTGLILQEIDRQKNLVFEWSSWDHIPITDTTVDLTARQIDYIHGNSVEIDFDGNWIISSRYTDEVTKISRQTGEVIWRLGGKGNQFTFEPGLFASDEPFFDQHDARRLDNGHLLLFDNRTGIDSEYARAVEYELDEINLIARPVWEHRAVFPGGSRAMGSARRLTNGNTLIGWGSMYPSVTEVTPEGEIAFELWFEQITGQSGIFTVNSYRAIKGDWVGNPSEPIALVQGPADPGAISIYYSWNGATEVDAYRIYAGSSANRQALRRSAIACSIYMPPPKSPAAFS